MILVALGGGAETRSPSRSRAARCRRGNKDALVLPQIKRQMRRGTGAVDEDVLRDTSMRLFRMAVQRRVYRVFCKLPFVSLASLINIKERRCYRIDQSAEFLGADAIMPLKFVARRFEGSAEHIL